MSPALRVTVREVITETADSISLVLDAPTGQFAYRPGQYVTLRVPHDNGPLARCYSLSSSAGMAPTITIKRVAGGAASNWLCDNTTAGMSFDVLPPAGQFVPRAWNVPFLLVAAGSGITPVMAILRTALSQHANPIRLFYANRDRESTIFEAELATLARLHSRRLTIEHWLESERGLPTAEAMRESLQACRSTQVYLCGPSPFMAAARDSLTLNQVPEANVHAEAFLSLSGDPFASDPFAPSSPTSRATSDETSTATVELDDEVHLVDWPRDAALLDVLLARGIDAPYVCREGTCGGCAFTLRRGEVEMRANHTLDRFDLARGTRLACQSEPRSETLDIAFDL